MLASWTSHKAAMATQMTMVALESALPPLRVTANCLRFLRSQTSSTDSSLAIAGGGWRMLKDMHTAGSVHSTEATVDGQVSVGMWAVVASLRKSIHDSGMMQQACSDLNAMTIKNGTFVNCTSWSLADCDLHQRINKFRRARPAPSMQCWRP